PRSKSDQGQGAGAGAGGPGAPGAGTGPQAYGDGAGQPDPGHEYGDGRGSGLTGPLPFCSRPRKSGSNQAQSSRQTELSLLSDPVGALGVGAFFQVQRVVGG